MKIGEKIAKRRKELDLTQEDLAKKLGYKSKSTINKIELGINDLTQSKVIKFAEALDVSVAYLMGWEDDHEPSTEQFRDEMFRDLQFFAKKKTPTGEETGERLSEAEKDLLACFRMLPESGQKAILVQLRALAAAQRSDGKLP